MATHTEDLDRQHGPTPGARNRAGAVVTVAIVGGLVVGGVLVALPVTPATGNALTGVVLLGFAVGWALLAVLSERSATSRNDGPTCRPGSWHCWELLPCSGRLPCAAPSDGCGRPFS
jgi:hypothetical protein